jgi:hypothetical protein
MMHGLNGSLAYVSSIPKCLVDPATRNSTQLGRG